MRNIILYIATSLDGYIAGPENQLDFLFDEQEFGYNDFIRTVDTTLMGYKTYAEVLGFGIPFPYADKTNFVFSRQDRPDDGNPVTFVREDPAAFVKQLKNSPGGKIWAIGGGQLNACLLEAGLIDEIEMYIHPVVLGDGIPLAKGRYMPRSFVLTSVSPHPSGVVIAKYRRESE